MKLSNSIERINDYSFSGCGIKSISLPDGIQSIGDDAFFYCTALSNIQFNEKLNTIGKDAFLGCASLKEINFSENITSIGGYAFEQCNALTEAKVPPLVTEVADGLYADCANLKEIKLHNRVKKIGGAAFRGCQSLQNVVLADSVTTVGEDAFSGDHNLTSVVLDGCVAEIGMCAFWACEALTDVTLGKNVSKIGQGAFGYCRALKNVILWSPNPPSVDSSTFEGCDSLNKIYVVNDAVSVYRADQNWGKFNVYGISNIGGDEKPVYVANNVGNEAKDIQNEIALDFIQCDDVSIGTGIATITNETTNEVTQLPVASIGSDASQAASRAGISDDFRISQQLGNAVKNEGYYTMGFPDGYFLLGGSYEKSPAFTLRFGVTEATGIHDINVDNDNDLEPELYNLQGVKVTGKVTPGVYIRVQGSKVTKVLIK